MGTDTSSPYSFSLDTKLLSDGSHAIKIIAIDKANNQATTQITIIADNTIPVVSITAPLDGDVVKGTIAVSVMASDNIGVLKVELYLDGSLHATDTSSPYSLSLDTKLLKNGDHTLLAKVYDKAGNASSDNIVIKVVG